ncbi:FkbM family methyltransferase [Aquamicrobium sp.]|uniref:FkbM family methyltransferase n=1 Tax=Aquamicrobium sp. TaxID=1872579 RepID=UPI0025881BAF|nr:FkbM family methyltransferase [Aquamicrobium sp.]MCK9549211.1 FkbM family methyltransferase [Aquamicrobium sp.]
MDLRAIRYEWLWWLHRDGVRIRTRSTEHGILIDTPEGTLRLASERRVGLYRRGIKARIDKVASAYGIAQHVTLRPGDLVLDIGANIGEFSLWAAARGARVIAFEPDPTTLACLRDNVSGKVVEVEPVGLWHEPASLSFFTAPDEADGSFIGNSGQSIQVNALPLDAIMARRDFPAVRLIKMDAEGAEPEVLRGATETLKFTSFIAVDVGEERNGKSTLDQCQKILLSTGFKPMFRNDDRGTILCARDQA